MPPRRKQSDAEVVAGKQTSAADGADVAPGEDSEAAKVRKKVDEAKAPEVGSPAWRRADDMRALEEELDMCKRAGKTDRVKAIEAAIKAAKSGAPKDRHAPEGDEA